MSTTLTFFGLLPFLISNPSTEFSVLLSQLTDSEKTIAQLNDVSNWNAYNDFLSSYSNSMSGGETTNDLSDTIYDLNDYFQDYYSDYHWLINPNNTAYTSDLTNHIPIEMLSSSFNSNDVMFGVYANGKQNITPYGGCGPIAVMGVLDYLARYLGYNEIMSDPTNEDSRRLLSFYVMFYTHFSTFSSQDATLVWPWDCASCFNDVVKKIGLEGKIVAKDYFTLFGGKKDYFWEKIQTSIKNGMPVSLFVGLESGNGEFAQHTTNVYGYETWIGIPKNGVGEHIEKKFLKARVNHADDRDIYCDADILNCPQIAIVTYQINYGESLNFSALDFASFFVNSNGNGQYFFYNINQPVLLSDRETMQTNRLRASVIENNYLVLSPNRNGAGTAYLEFNFNHPVELLSFSSSLWSNSENILGQKFKIQYWDNSWIDYFEINLSDMSKSKDNLKIYKMLFPKNVTNIRFYSEHLFAGGNKNKGRICLDDFILNYN